MQQFWKTIKPSYHARRGAILAAALTVLWAGITVALNLQSGFGLAADFAFTALVALVGIPMVAVVTAGVLTLVRPLPRVLTGFFLAATAFVSLLWFSPQGWLLAAVLLFIECCAGATLSTILRRGLQAAPVEKRTFTWTILMLAIAANIGIFAFLRNDVPPSPARPVSWRCKTLFYGSGDSLRRPEFGPSVAIRTRTVDATPFLDEMDGWKAFLRKRYWGFGMDKLPLNAEVFYPEGAGPFPLFVVVHGNHEMSVPSDEGYGYLCEHLASRGFIAVSVDENFLNSGFFHDLPNNQVVRAWLLLEHLRLWHEWANNPASPFYGKVDLNNIALAGHSRGGEAAATAALFNHLSHYPDDASIEFHYNYGIRSIVAIAPADGQYKPADQYRVLKDVNYLTLQGSNDADISSFVGSRQYEHVQFTGAVPAFKSEIYIYGANHSQFNTMWGRTDHISAYTSTAAGWFLNLQPLLSGDTQRQMATHYITAFLEATLHGNDRYRNSFRNRRSGLVNRYQDQTYKPVCTFDEDADVTTATAPDGHISANGLSTWREGRIPFRSGDRDHNGVFLGWDSANAGYAIDMPEIAARALDLSVAATEDDSGPTVFTVEVSNSGGRKIRIPVTIPPPIHVQFTKLKWLDTQLFGSSFEPVFQSVHVSLNDLQSLNHIRLVFDKTHPAQLIISGIGLDRP